MSRHTLIGMMLAAAVSGWGDRNSAVAPEKKTTSQSVELASRAMRVEACAKVF